MDVKYNFLNKLGITKLQLDSKVGLPHLKVSDLTNGVVIDLFNLAKVSCKASPAEEVALLLSLLLHIDFNTISLDALKTNIYRIIKDKKSKGGKGLQLFLTKLFSIPTSTIVNPSREERIEQSVILELATDLSRSEKELKKSKQVTSQLQKSKKALKRKITSSEKKIEKLKKAKLQTESKTSLQKIMVKEKISFSFKSKSQGWFQQSKVLNSVNLKLKKNIKEKDFQLAVLKKEVESMKQLIEEKSNLIENGKDCLNKSLAEKNELILENNYLRNLLNDNEELVVYDESTKTFCTELVNCIMNLQDSHVAASNIWQVINEVCKLCSRVPNKLPSTTTINRISDMKLSLTTKHIEEISKKENLTLYSDETSKFGKSFEVFAVTDDEKNSYLLGLREMYSKGSETVLDTFKEILNDVNLLCSKSSSEHAGYRILINIKNTMSDRASTEKKFHSLLESYRSGILSEVKENWDSLSVEEKAVCTKMNNFFCSLHLIVNFADVCAEALRKFEHLNLSAGNISQPDLDESEQQSEAMNKSESGTIRLIRTCSKAFSKGVDERSGVYGKFNTYLKEKGDAVKFIRHTHNRFNIFLFLDK